jgi:predicted TIM-barrel fold metal-dependent hydrolase
MKSHVIDVHCHFYESKAVANWMKTAYDLWEYGEKEDVAITPVPGDLDDLRQAIKASGLDAAVVVNCFGIDNWRDRSFAGLVDGLKVGKLGDSSSLGLLGAWLIGHNQWLVKAVSHVPEVIPFVAIDPWVLSQKQTREHLVDMRSRGARGAKMHPVMQHVRMEDELAVELARTCAELDLALVVHSGASRGSIPFGEPHTLTKVAGIAGLKFVVAHMGGAAWSQTAALAEAYPEILFDLSEIIAWFGASEAPTPEQFVELIRAIGIDRVMFGSDFPWYHPKDMLEVVMELPGFSELELTAILGENAARELGLS